MRDFITFIIIVLFAGCNQKSANDTSGQIKKTTFYSFLKSEKLEKNRFKKVIIIPGAGCGGCISKAQENYYKNYKDTNTLYIFTTISDSKLFKNTLPDQALNYKNLILDTTNFMVKYGFKSIYPSEIILTNSETLNIIPIPN